jgi:hypothetical protein
MPFLAVPAHSPRSECRHPPKMAALLSAARQYRCYCRKPRIGTLETYELVKDLKALRLTSIGR